MTYPKVSRRSLLAAGSLAFAGLALNEARSARAADPPGKIAFVRSGDIYSWENGDTTQITNNGSLTSPRWGPDGTQLLYVQTGNSFSDLYLFGLEDGSTSQLTFNQPPDDPVGGKDYVDNSVWVIDPCWSNSGVLGYASDPFTPYGSLALWIADAPGDTPERFLPAPAPYAGVDDYYQSVEGISLSDDGSVATYTTRLVDDDTGELYSIVQIQDLSTTDTSNLADDPDGSFDPAMEPGGDRVALAIRSGEVSDIWLIDRAGGARTQVTQNANATKPCWANDGTWLAWSQMSDFKFEVWGAPVVNGGFGTAQQLFAFDDFDPTGGLSWWMG